MLELVSVDGRSIPPEEGLPAQRMPEKVEMEQTRRLELLAEGQARIVSMLLAQQAEISRLAQALSTVRISRTQELALQDAIRRRARELTAQSDLPANAQKRIASAIRTTLRETTGVRAVGDLQAAQFDRALAMVSSWRMEGALRRIRREVGQGAKKEARDSGQG